MDIVRVKDYSELSEKAAEIFCAQIKAKPDSVLGLATGSTVLGMYKILIERFERGELDFSRVMTFNLDEYVGLGADNEQSYRYYMDSNLFDKINIVLENTMLPNGLASDIAAECVEYNALIENKGIDIQLLGLGNNGHIGFNEPDEFFIRKTHIVDLNEDTIIANARFFDSADDVPKQAITMGIAEIMSAKQIVLCVSGPSKARALKAVLTGEITPEVPGSVLQLHRNCTLVADECALSEVEDCECQFTISKLASKINH